jgi:putative endonuclease
MANHLELGNEGEALAEKWLVQNGYSILHKNWQYFQNEIDIIATKGKYLHFIEVKTRRYSPFSNPEDAVTKQKFRNMMRVANGFLQSNPQHEWIRYDILALTRKDNGEYEYFFIEDVFL